MPPAAAKPVHPHLSAGYNDKRYRVARPDDEKEIEDAFDVFDVGNKEYLTYYEFKSAIKGLGFDLPTEDLKLVFHEFSTENSRGRGLNRPDFIAFGRRLYEYQPLQEKLSMVFSLIDTTKRGSIGITDLRRAASLADLEFEERDLKGMIDAFDLQGLGTISFEDFCALCDEDLFEEISIDED